MHPRHPFRPLLACALALLLTLAPQLAGAGQPAAETHPPQVIPPEKSCGVCGMYPAQYPQWQTEVLFKDNSMTAFDGGKCMFRFLRNMAKFAPDRTEADIAMIWVKDFATGAWVDGTTASYVVASDVLGPMGKELIPFASEEAAQKFRQQHGGTVEPYDRITMETLKPLMGGMMHGPHGQGQMHHMP
jgi:nitrous oxide reductase accessory protein NosL